jgi:hypothetical protein
MRRARIISAIPNKHRRICKPPECPGGTTPEFSRLALPRKIAPSHGDGDHVMLARVSDLRSPTGRGFRYLFGGLSVLVATVSIVTAIEVSLAPAWSGAVPIGETINRASKGDRLPPVPTLHPDAVNRSLEVNRRPRTRAPQSLTEGCEALVSPLARTPLAYIAGRCLS